ncbi:hypothetical protein K2173_000722 [Erythroxylum novogranatense]|uniref:U-box domain-containing protein n=1 Tax=Erythroxylum novogranatense TaxID=1862640 RepID=A0AAV8SI78_9ROSI|nr:hypothetical protein K2173_000722 [Erythroxylum novogranatense]
MKDPVTLPTGITYDRESIEKWLISGKNSTCPVTKQDISDCDLTPNHTLRRLIQSWCMLNASHGIERIPTPKPPVNRAEIAKLLNSAKSPQQQIKCLRELRSISGENNTNKRCMEAAGVVDFLASIVNNLSSYPSLEESSDESFDQTAGLVDEALSILHSLQISESGLKSLVHKNGDIIQSLTKVMQRGSYESRAYAVLLLKSVLEVTDPMKLIGLRPELFVETVQVLRDQISLQASKAALQLLINACPEKGRGDVTKRDRFVVPMRGRKSRAVEAWSWVSHCFKEDIKDFSVASDEAVRVLLSISKFSATPSVLQEMLHIGVVSKLCLVLQLEGSRKTKEKTRRFLNYKLEFGRTPLAYRRTFFVHIQLRIQTPFNGFLIRRLMYRFHRS